MQFSAVLSVARKTMLRDNKNQSKYKITIGLDSALDSTRSLSVMFVRLVQHAAAPLTAGVWLYLICQMYNVPFSSNYAALGLMAMMLTAVFVSKGSPNHARIRLFSMHAGTLITGWIIVVGALLLIGYATKTSAIFSRLVLFAWFVTTPVVILLSQWSLQELLLKAIDLSDCRRRVVIAGVNDVSKQLAANIHADSQLGLELVGFFEDRKPSRFGELFHGELLGQLKELVSFVNREEIDTIYIALPIKHMARSQVLLDELQDTTASVYFVPDIFVFDLIQSRIDDINGVPVFALCETPYYGYNAALKRLFDLAAASLILMLISPLMVAIATGVKLTSAGPILFKQRRYGLDGKEILVYKFRTMTVAEDGDHIVQAHANDARFTPFGAWLRRHSLDELPQFMNVIHGEMSVVGPRPHAVAQNEMYRKLIKGYMIRHKVLPGITGWAQVNGCRGETREVAQMEDRVQFDLEYLRKWSITMDLKIILRTMGLVIRDNAAH